MKRIAFSISVATLLFGVGILAKTQAGSVEQELMKLETDWANAYIKRDADSMNKILADDYMGTDAEGSISTKAQHIEIVKSHKEEMLSVVSDEWKVRVYGDAAVVMARNTVKMQLEGKESTFQTRFTDTWVKSGGRWQCVASHISIMPQ